MVYLCVIVAIEVLYSWNKKAVNSGIFGNVEFVLTNHMRTLKLHKVAGFLQFLQCYSGYFAVIILQQIKGF